MKLLICTQAVDRNEPLLGFFLSWLTEFAKHADEVLVFALRVGEYDLPENVRVVPLRPHGEDGRLRTALRLITLSWKHRHDYDAVFVHMTMEHILAAGWLWRLLGKRIALWYTHGTVSLRLRLAIPFVHTVFTASPESMRVRTPKKRVVRHGIDTSFFSSVQPLEGEPVFITVNRLAPVKRIEVLMEAAANAGVRLRIIGAARPEDAGYASKLHALARDIGQGRIEFLGPRDQAGVRAALSHAHVFLHASATGSIDKVPLEALATGMPAITSNEELGAISCSAIIPVAGSVLGFEKAIIDACERQIWADPTVRNAARALITEKYSIAHLIPRIMGELNEGDEQDA